jgi:two-component system response regulator DesR
MMMIRVVVAEDQTMVLEALAALLDSEEDIQVVGMARNGREVLELVRTLAPDVLVADIEMPEMSGLEVASAIRGMETTTRVVILTTFARPGYLRRALEAGAGGYLLKDSPSADLAAAIRRVSAGLRAVDPALAREAWTEHDPLTDRERRVLRLAAEGKATAAIAATLGLSTGTVRNYLCDAIGKLSASNRAEASRIARDKGWL